MLYLVCWQYTWEILMKEKRKLTDSNDALTMLLRNWQPHVLSFSLTLPSCAWYKCQFSWPNDFIIELNWSMELQTEGGPSFYSPVVFSIQSFWSCWAYQGCQYWAQSFMVLKGSTFNWRWKVWQNVWQCTAEAIAEWRNETPVEQHLGKDKRRDSKLCSHGWKAKVLQTMTRSPTRKHNTESGTWKSLSFQRKSRTQTGLLPFSSYLN